MVVGVVIFGFYRVKSLFYKYREKEFDIMFFVLDEEKVNIYDRFQYFKKDYEVWEIFLLEVRFEIKLLEMLSMEVDILKWNRFYFY